jgi:peptidoglycan hydrolase-like protein with peptidoglycan-binding domain
MKTRLGIVLCVVAGLTAGADMNYKEAQQILKSKGYYSGEVDGLNGPQTEAALTHFQQDQGLPVNGELDDKTAKELQASMPKEALGTMKGAGKDVGSSAKSEGKSAWDEIKSVFHKSKSTEQ